MDTPSAVFVILPEDIRRSGARSIPEALRMAPGLQVARLDANKWAISSRGFNGRFSNKLLVLMDGRSVYTPLFSGVFWDVQDTFLEDIERIEVIRGPGATVWGANAVNGVINIITKPASHTKGVYASGGVGTEYRDFASGRYGGPSGEESDVYYRAYGKYQNNDGFGGGHDDWFMARGGFRTDYKIDDGQTFTALGDIYDGEVGDRVTVPTLTPPFSRTFNEHTPVRGSNILGRWTLKTSEQSQLSVQSWFEYTSRINDVVAERRRTFEMMVDHRFSPLTGHDLTWGAEFRFTEDEIVGSESVQFDPDHRDAVIGSFYLQDEMTIVRDRLQLTLGCKFEYNTFSRHVRPLEVQPNVRLAWTPDAAHAVWLAAARAVRTSSRAESDARAIVAVDPVGPTAFTLIGNQDFHPEELLALEAGYRMQPREEISFDLATFVNLYDDLRTFEPGVPFPAATPVPHVILPLDNSNRMMGRTYGVELSVTTRPFPWWKMQASYAFLYLNLIPDSDSRDPTAESIEHENPANQIYFRSSWDLGANVDLDVMPRYVSGLSALNVEAYVELDARLAWRPWKNGEVSVTGQNLLHRSHMEFAPSILSTEPTRPERGGYLMVAVRF
ncbi:MAG: TonB-dependent receptor [Planctomycetota bacterium]|nr:MAG: TonB-dependent receptor [Planctomycetota bacterium]